MPGSHAPGFSKRDGNVTRCLVVAAHQNITVKRVSQILQVMGGHVLECGHHLYAIAEHRLQSDNCGASGRQLHAADFGRHEGVT